MVDYGLVRVMLNVLVSSLKPRGKVHYFVVNAFCRLFFHNEHPRTSKKHYFFSRVGVSFLFFYCLLFCTCFNCLYSKMCIFYFDIVRITSLVTMVHMMRRRKNYLMLLSNVSRVPIVRGL